MGWSIGFDREWRRDIGYGVPAKCDHPDCDEDIHRGLSYVCGHDPYGGDTGCGLYFCSQHLTNVWDDAGDELATDANGNELVQLCERCVQRHENPDDSIGEPFTPKPDLEIWMIHKLNDESWQQWRAENPGEVEKLRQAVSP